MEVWVKRNKITQQPSARQRIEVWADWDWMMDPQCMGILFVSKSRGKEIFSFEYDPEWLRSDEARILDPSLQLDKGIQYADPDRGNFGLFLDSSPDRWGRVLMQRRESRNARIEKRAARSLGQRRAGDDHSQGTSYLELVDFITQAGAKPDEDLEELWRRIVFFICVSNTDDHLRNHGFLLGRNGWRLAPAYDVNPVPSGEGLKLNISESDNSQDLDLALSVAGLFRLKPTRAREIVAGVIKVVKRWPQVAERLNLPRSERELMSRAFRVADSHPA
jgi:hypothetical protein